MVNQGRNVPKARVLYILGLPYSGSTIFALALGAAEGLVNLGEVSFLEHDYKASIKCLCGELLPDCPFWGPLKAELDRRQAGVQPNARFQLSDEGGIAPPDRRKKPFTEQIKLGLGIPLEKIYSKEVLDSYMSRNVRFFSAAADVTGGRTLIDVSKSPQRLELLLRIPEIEVRVIRLDRDPAAVLASRMERSRGKRGKIAPLSSIRQILWLAGLNGAIRRIYDRLPETQKTTVSFQAFMENPAEILGSLAEFIGEGRMSERPEGRDIRLVGQHIYVGNRWVFETPTRKSVEIARPKPARPLHPWDRALYGLTSLCIPALRR